MNEFQEFPKMARYSREVIVTEKIDGTNAQIFIGENGEFLTGSRTRWITPDNDNFGFSKWAHEHKDELMQLGPGRHFGEWWGSGIQRGYGLTNGERRFSLFNVSRWCLHGTAPSQIPSADTRVVKMQDTLPPCVGLVPVLWNGRFDMLDVPYIISTLNQCGSCAAPGFMRPEGIVIYHVAAGIGFKKTIEKDEVPKSMAGLSQ
jgi:hypothetical protein